MASSFLPGFFGSQMISALPRITRLASPPAISDGRGAGRVSSVTPGFRTAGFAICITSSIVAGCASATGMDVSYRRSGWVTAIAMRAMRYTALVPSTLALAGPVARLRAARAGEDRSRHQLEDPPRGDGQLADSAHPALPDRRLRPAADRVAQPEGGPGLGRQRDHDVGPEERAPRAVVVRPPRLGQREAVGARRSRRSRTRSSPRRWRGRRAPTVR